jgi:hypothetical protein
MMDTPSVQDRMRELGIDLVQPELRSSEYLRTFVESEINKWAAPIKARPSRGTHQRLFL